MHSFEATQRQRLGEYRSSVLGIEERGTFQHRGIVRDYDHILPAAAYEQNILPCIREKFWSRFAAMNVKRHKYFHHLNSSQALCFNLFFPLLNVPGAFESILESIGSRHAFPQEACFEAVPDAAEGTNIDFLLPLQSGGKVLFEIKFTEADFGQAEDDAKHRDKYETLYKPRFDERFHENFTERAIFFRHYQIMRNILHLCLEKGDRVVFLVPRANRSLAKFLPSIHKCVSEPARHHVHILFLEDVVAGLEALNHPGLSHPLAEFRQKYL